MLRSELKTMITICLYIQNRELLLKCAQWQMTIIKIKFETVRKSWLYVMKVRYKIVPTKSYFVICRLAAAPTLLLSVLVLHLFAFISYHIQIVVGSRGVFPDWPAHDHILILCPWQLYGHGPADSLGIAIIARLATPWQDAHYCKWPRSDVRPVAGRWCTHGCYYHWPLCSAVGLSDRRPSPLLLFLAFSCF